MANNTKMLYTGVTNNLERRVFEHKNHLIAGYTKKYNITKLVYYEETNDVQEAMHVKNKSKDGCERRKLLLLNS
jgi:putative endonuclease